jgi:peptide/nickel transport system substrate-binding protein
MHLTHKFLPLSLVSLVALSACTTTTQTSSTTTTTTTTTSTGTASGGVLPEFHATSPGDYTTATAGDAEMKVGRYPAGKYGGTLIRPIVGSDPKTFNYWQADDTNSRMIAGYMLGGLTTDDAYTGEVVPDLAESVIVQPDKVTYITKLKKGLKWSDGKPITSADVAYTWSTIINGGYGNSSLRDVTQIEGKSPTVTAVDDLTNKFVTPKPFVPFKRLLSIPIAPKHVFEPITNKPDGHQKFSQKWATTTDAAKLASFVTSGPFVISRFVPSQRVELVRTNNYYMLNKEGKRLPYLDKILFVFVPDPNVLLLKFRNKEIDVSTVRARDLQTLLADREKTNSQIYRLGPSLGSTFIMFNMNQRKNAKGKPYVDPIRSKWFNDTNFRQAVNHAVNRDLIIANYFKGIAYPAFTSEPSTSLWINPNLTPFKPDKDYSANLLAKSGFVKKAGLLYDKDGNKVEFDMVMAAGSPFYEACAQQLKQDLKNLGITVNYQALEFNSLINRMDGTKEWECAIFSLSGGDPLEPNSSSNVWRSNSRLHIFDLRFEPGKVNTVVPDARPWEREIDDIFTRGAQIFDPAERKKLYDRYQQIVYDEAPLIYLVTPTALLGARNTVGNYTPTQLSASVGDGLHNLDEIYKTDGTSNGPAPVTMTPKGTPEVEVLTGPATGTEASTTTGATAGTTTTTSTTTTTGTNP